MFDLIAPQQGTRGSRDCLWWDFPDLLSWPQVNRAVRVVRSLETWSVRRQLDKRESIQTSDWIWATTLSAAQTSTAWGRRFWPPAMGYRESCLQRTGQPMASRPRF